MKQIGYLGRGALILAITLCSSCTRLPCVPTCGEFDGVKTSLADCHTTTLFMTHGMGGYSEGDPHDLVCAVTQELNLHPDGPPTARKICRGEPEREYGCLERQDYVDPCCGHRLQVYFLDWRKATWDEKSLLRKIDEAACLASLQAPWNCKWRMQMINDVIADVSLYLGCHGEQIRYAFKQAVRWLYHDAKDDPNHNTVVITFSLGSQMLLDALSEMNSTSAVCPDPVAKAARNWLVCSTRSFFLMSNQFPLVELHRMPPRANRYSYDDGACCETCATCATDTELCTQFQPLGVDWDHTSIGEFVLDKRKQVPCFQLINFTDPNDLLGFILHTDRVPYCGCGATSNDLIQNVLVRNVRSAIFGQIAHPAKAHQDYGENPEVLGMVTYGLHTGSSYHACD